MPAYISASSIYIDLKAKEIIFYTVFKEMDVYRIEQHSCNAVDVDVHKLDFWAEFLRRIDSYVFPYFYSDLSDAEVIMSTKEKEYHDKDGVIILVSYEEFVEKIEPLKTLIKYIDEKE